MIVTQLFSQIRKVAVLAGLVLLSVSATATFAAAPMTKTANPGFFSFMVGDFEVTALSDGTADLPVDKLLSNTTLDKVNSALSKAHLKSPLESSFNGYLVNTGAKLVLIDTGAGALFGPTLGYLVGNLKAAGYTPEQVDEIYITHMHPDHVGGLVKDGQKVFPNAIIRADKAESDFWLSQANLDKAPAESKGFFQGAMAALNPYVSAGQYKPFEGSLELVPGIKALETKGHTPGHTSYVVESKGVKLVVIGDLIHVAAVQFADPSVTIGFDSDTESAKAERMKIFSDAAKQGYLIAAAHIAFPGVGYIATVGKGFAWEPINYTQIR